MPRPFVEACAWLGAGLSFGLLFAVVMFA